MRNRWSLTGSLDLGSSAVEAKDGWLGSVSDQFGTNHHLVLNDFPNSLHGHERKYGSDAAGQLREQEKDGLKTSIERSRDLAREIQEQQEGEEPSQEVRS
jgi:hypothetical protein